MIELLIVGAITSLFLGAGGAVAALNFRSARKEYHGYHLPPAALPTAMLPPVPMPALPQHETEAIATVRDTSERASQDWQYQHQQQPDNNQESNLIELDLPQKMVFSTKSIIISAPPGSGKTFLVRAFLVELISQFKDVELLIIDQKNRPWMGLEHSGCVVVPTRNNYEPLTSTVATVAAKLEKRTHLSEVEVERSHRIWLVIDDYFSLYQNAPNVLDKAQFKKLSSDLNYIITVGREFRVMACVITHSLNVEALGFNRDIRGCSSMLVLGRIDTTDEEQEDGGFGAIATAINNPNIIASEAQRTNLIALLSELEAEATKWGLPAFFTTMGRPRLGVIPDLRWIKNYSFSASKSREAIAPIPQQPTPTPTELTTEQAKVAFLYYLPSELPQHEQPLAPHLEAILRYARKRGGSVKVREIQPAKLPELEGRTAEEIREYFRELAALRRADVEGEGGNLKLTVLGTG